APDLRAVSGKGRGPELVLRKIEEAHRRLAGFAQKVLQVRIRSHLLELGVLLLVVALLLIELPQRRLDASPVRQARDLRTDEQGAADHQNSRNRVPDNLPINLDALIEGTLYPDPVHSSPAKKRLQGDPHHRDRDQERELARDPVQTQHDPPRFRTSD